MKRVLIALAIVAAATIAFSSPALAQGNTFKVYVAAAYVSPLSSEDVTIDGISDSVEASSEVGYDFGIEWRFGKWLGVELDYLDAKHDVEFGGQKVAEVDMNPLTLGVNFHLIHTKFIDFYVAPNVSWVNWGDIQSVDTLDESVPTDSETAFGATVGVDVSLFKSVALVASLRYLQVDVTPEGGDGVGVDPLFTRVGVAFRF